MTGVAAFSGACLLAACGSSDDQAAGGSSGGSAESSGGSSSGGSGSGGAGSGVPAADVSVGSGVVKGDAPDPYVVTQPQDGEFKAFSAICTHSGCTVGSVEDNRIVCPCHGSEFDATTGEVLAGPASAPLEQYSVTKDGDMLVVEA